MRTKHASSTASAVLMYRLDAGFTDAEWRTIFEHMHAARIETVLYVPTTYLTALSLWKRKSRGIIWFLERQTMSFAGYLRSKQVFQSYWKGLYREEEVIFAGLKGFVLKREEK